MKKLISRIFISFLGGLIVDVGACVFTIIYLMFTSPDDQIVNRTGLFGAVIFKLTPLDDGGINIAFGLNSATSFLLIWLTVTLFIFVCMYLFSMLYAYRQELVARQSQENTDSSNDDANSDDMTATLLNELAASSTDTPAGDNDRNRNK